MTGNPWRNLALFTMFTTIGAVFGAGIGWLYPILAGTACVAFTLLALGWRSGHATD